ncbi:MULTISPECIES: hypothetical protein [unclassified Nostoc]|uniref:hypothetical protein n=1 Tax=unclassified Nostoc TaxID=2593658 RepID=UPI002FF5CE7C
MRLDYSSPKVKAPYKNTMLYVYEVAGCWFSFAGEVFPEFLNQHLAASTGISGLPH